MSIDVQIGQKIANARRAAGLSVTVLADYLDLPESKLRDVEAGTMRISAKLIHKTAQCLGQDIKWFFETSPAHVHEYRANQVGIEQDNTHPTTVLMSLRSNKNLQALCKSANAAQYAILKSSIIA